MSGEINRRLKELETVLSSERIAEVGFKKFRSVTPIGRTRTAVNNTKLNGTTIETDYAYARVLDAGRGFRDGQMRGSTQAPKGMTEPTIEEVRTYIRDQAKG